MMVVLFADSCILRGKLRRSHQADRKRDYGEAV